MMFYENNDNISNTDKYEAKRIQIIFIPFVQIFTINTKENEFTNRSFAFWNLVYGCRKTIPMKTVNFPVFPNYGREDLQKLIKC